MTLEEKKLLKDIEVSITNIDVHLNGDRSLQHFSTNITTRRAIERELEIIGEATNKLLKLNQSIALTSARQIIALRNRVIHAYDDLDDFILWKVIEQDIPILQKEVSALLVE